jgi:hypothetical protein
LHCRYRALSAIALQAAVNAEFVKLFGCQRYQQQQQQQSNIYVISSAHSLFSRLISTADALHVEADGSSATLDAIHNLSSLPDLPQFLDAGVNRVRCFCFRHTSRRCFAALRLLPRVSVAAADMDCIVTSRAGNAIVIRAEIVDCTFAMLLLGG